MLLEIEDLSVEFRQGDERVLAVNRLSLHVAEGETLGLVGESGSGKSVSARAILRLLPATAVVSGQVRLAGRDLGSLSEREMTEVRGRDISIVFQEPMTSINPSFTIGFQLDEVLRRHLGMNRRAARERTVELLDSVGIPAPRARARAHPHELSGGMLQRVLVAMAIACNPKVLIADEPTSALDPTMQLQILDLLADLRERLGLAVIFISHDLGVVAEIADRVVVLYAAHGMEIAPARELFTAPRHPYTAGLVAARPRLVLDGEPPLRMQEIPGTVPTLHGPTAGCVFAPRCPRVHTRCLSEVPSMADGAQGEHGAACFYPLGEGERLDWTTPGVTEAGKR
jgi:peptide/nickel transport system ATP-binding protein